MCWMCCEAEHSEQMEGYPVIRDMVYMYETYVYTYIWQKLTAILNQGTVDVCMVPTVKGNYTTVLLYLQRWCIPSHILVYTFHIILRTYICCICTLCFSYHDSCIL